MRPPDGLESGTPPEFVVRPAPFFVASSVDGAGEQRSEMCLDTLERPCVSRTAVLDVQRRSFLIDVFVAIPGVRVVAQPLRSARAALLLDRPEHVGHIARVVPGARHDVGPEQVGLSLELSTESQEGRAETELRALCDDGTRATADDRPQNRAGDLPHRVRRGLRLLRRAMTQRHVAQLVRHHAGDLPFGVRLLHHPAVDEHRPAREREGVDLLHVHTLEGVAEFRMLEIGGNRIDQPAADVVEIRVHVVVVHHGQLTLHLLAPLPARASRRPLGCTCSRVV